MSWTGPVNTLHLYLWHLTMRPSLLRQTLVLRGFSPVIIVTKSPSHQLERSLSSVDGTTKRLDDQVRCTTRFFSGSRACDLIHRFTLSLIASNSQENTTLETKNGNADENNQERAIDLRRTSYGDATSSCTAVFPVSYQLRSLASLHRRSICQHTARCLRGPFIMSKSHINRTDCKHRTNTILSI